jgi:hypothetical protein
MVGVINPNASVSIEDQITGAKNSKYMLQPGENFPSEGSSSSQESYPSSTSSLASASATTSAAIVSSSTKSSSFPKAAIAGIVIGAIVLLGLAAGFCFFFGRAKTLKEEVNRQALHPSVMSMRSPGHLSPAPPSIVDPMYQSGGTVYIPVKATDLHRVSLPPYGGQPMMGSDVPTSPGNGHSPGQNHATINHYEVGNYVPYSSSSPPQPYERFV